MCSIRLRKASRYPREPFIVVPEPTDEKIEKAAALLGNARRPLIYAGGGAVSSGAAPFVLQLAERLKAPVMTSIMGKGAIPEDHPLSLGALWSAGNVVDDYLKQADVVIVIGSKLGAQATQMFRDDVAGEPDPYRHRSARNALERAALHAASGRCCAGQ